MTLYVSILENNLDHTFQFFIVNDKIDEEDKVYLKQLENIYNNVQKVTFVDVNEQFYKTANVDRPANPIPQNTYYRLELPNMLSVSRILYLDADMLCTGNIGDLWNTDLHQKTLGAIREQYLPHGSPRLPFLHVTNRKNGYFNAGLLLIDVNKWKQRHITQRARKLIAERGNELTYADQDTLNELLNGYWEPLPPKYNVEPYLTNLTFKFPFTKKQIQEARQHPIIIHYSGWAKPWVRYGKSIHPWRNQYFWYKYIATQRLHDYAFNQKNETDKKIMINKKSV